LLIVSLGSKCIVEGATVSGKGVVLADTPLMQTYSYWEIKVISGKGMFL
jgi:hypothetical protein